MAENVVQWLIVAGKHAHLFLLAVKLTNKSRKRTEGWPLGHLFYQHLMLCVKENKKQTERT